MRASLTIGVLLAATLIAGVAATPAQERYVSAAPNEDGTVRIEIADGGQVRVHVEPRLPPEAGDWQHVGVQQVRVSGDGTAVGWLATFSECCAYGHAQKLVVRTNGRLHVIDGRTVIWRWNFVGNGTQVGYMAMPLHGTTVEGYYLVEVATGRVIATHAHDMLEENAPSLPPWVEVVNEKK